MAPGSTTSSMTPAQSVRLWARRAPAAERGAAAAAAAALLLVAALLMPTQVGGSAHVANATTALPGSGSAATGGPAAGARPAAGPLTSAAGPGGSATQGPLTAAGTSTRSGAVPATGGGAQVGGGPAAGGAAGAGARCPATVSGVRGVTDKTIRLGVMLVAVAGAAANSTFGVASVDQQKAYANAAVDDLNRNGGVACRRVVTQFFQGNPADQSDLQQKCLDVQQSGVFAVVDVGAYSISSVKGCFGQNGIPYFGGYLIADSLRLKFAPYMFELGSYDRTYHDTVVGLKEAGFFTAAKGFTKLGFAYRSCFPEVIDKIRGWLRQAGVPSSAVVEYDIGCPEALANPADLQQAVLKFQRANVSSVTTAFFVGDFSNFTKIAQQQQFRPKYGLPDDQLITTSYGNLRPDYNNIDGAIAISLARSAEETTPGSTPTAGTRRCDTIFARHGLAPTYKQPYAAGNTCDQIWMFAAAVDDAPALQANALARGLQLTKSIDFSFPEGPSDFTSGTTTGGEFWRPTAFTTSCNCWRITSRTFRPSTY